MASTIMRKEANTYRHDYILEAIKQRDISNPIRAKDLADSLLISVSTVAREVKKIRAEYPEQLKIGMGKNHGGYYWKHVTMPRVDTITPVIFDRYPITKNDEGYPDPTAALAIMNSEGNHMLGEIYEFKNSVGYSKFLVIASTEHHVTGYMLYEEYDEISEAEKPAVVKVNTGDSVWFYNPKRIFTKPSKYCLDRLCELSDKEKAILTDKVRDYLGFEKEDRAQVERLAVEAANNKVRCDDLLKEAESLRRERDSLKDDNKKLEEKLNDILFRKNTERENEILQMKIMIYEDLFDRLLPRRTTI